MPSYANLFLGLWERESLLTNPVQNIEKIHLRTRYKYDILLIWQGLEQDLIELIDVLNRNNKNIKLTLKYSQVSFEFLDVHIYRDHNGYIQTDMFRKEMAVNLLLHLIQFQ